MATIRYTFLFIVVVFVAVHNAHALPDKSKLKEMIEPVLEECAKENELDTAQLANIKETKVANDDNACFFSCCFKKLGIIDKNGLFNMEVALGKIKENNEGDALKKIEDVAKQCVKVNDEPVADGEKGCERAKLLSACIMDQWKNFEKNMK